MIVKTNVKLNLGLSVLRKRADGFHDIETLFVPCFDFGDTIEIITGDDYSRSSAALFAKYGAPDGRFDASTGSVTGRLSDRQEASVGEPVEPTVASTRSATSAPAATSSAESTKTLRICSPSATFIPGKMGEGI